VVAVATTARAGFCSTATTDAVGVAVNGGRELYGLFRI
jgi:hypothetical protein